MKLSAEGRLRLAARVLFVVGIGALTTEAIAQEVAAATPTSDGAATAQANTAKGTGDGASVSSQASGEAVKLQGVQVTGSRIKSVNLTGNSPVTVVNSQELKFEGTTRVEDLVNNLPQAFADQGGNISNGSTGTASVNLRNLGSARTLVLVDGKRLSPGNPGDTNADLNFIPSQLVDRVEVLTGGASAVYGTDAVAGVVNFVTKKDFEGVRIDYQRSGYLHDNNNGIGDIVRARGFATPDSTTFDGGGNNLSLIWGVNSGDGKGNATVYASYLQLDPITQAKRDFSACTLAERGANTFSCSGSSTSFPGRFLGDDGNSYTIDPTTGNTFIPYSSARNAFNFGPYNYFQRNDERYLLGGFAHYKFNEHADAYTQLMFSDDHTDAVIAPSGAFFGNVYSIPCNNPLLSADEQSKLCASTASTDSTQVLIGRRNVEGGGRDADFRHLQYRIVTGLRGDIAQGWSYDTSIQYGTTILNQIYRNDFSNVRLNRALNVTTDPATGAPVCQSVLDGSDPNCVPYNIFSLGGVTPAALSYLQTPGLLQGQTVQQVATGSISGNLGRYGLQSPFAKEGVGLAFGGEYRRETARLEPDTEFTTGDLAGQGGATLGIQGGYSVKEVFAETRIPLVQEQPFVEALSADAGYRYSQYSSTASTNTYKFGGEYAPTKDVRFRGGYNRAVRAPAIGEIANPTNVALDGNTDPCAGAIDPATGVVSGGATRAQCANDPVIAANPGLYGNILENPAAQYNGQTGTSPGLKSEKADTYTAGFVFTPTFAKNFNLSVDYYDIKVKGLIGAYGADTILSTCYTTGALCNLINRDPTAGPTQGSLWLGQRGYVIDTTQNTGALQVRGIDLNANYRFRLADIGLSSRAGSMAIDFVGTRDLKEKHAVIPGTTSADYQCQGKYGLQCGTPVPLWRHKLRATYTVPTELYSGVASFSTAWRYISSVRADELSGPNDADRRLSSRNYIDLTAAMTFKGSYTFRVGVNNVFDKDPPIIGSGALPGVFGNGNTFPQVYDALGRYLFAGMTVDF